MVSVVGGRMEAIAPSRSLFTPDYLRIAALVVISATVHLWLIGHTSVTARDGIGFGRYAINLATPQDANRPVAAGKAENPPKRIETAIDVIGSQEQHPGYPVAVWLTAKFVRRAEGVPEPDAAHHAVQFLLAAQIVSAIAALLLVVPTYLIGRMLFGRFVGFASALLLQVLPVPARVTSDALSEGVYLLTVAVAVMLAVRAVRRPGVGGFLLCGLTVGMSYLVRPEGLMVIGAVGLTAGWLGLTRRWPRDLTVGRLAALAVGVALVAGPYVLLIGKLTNKPTGDGMIPSLTDPRGQMLKDGFGFHRPVTVGAPVFADYWEIPGNARPVWVVERAAFGMMKEVGKALHYVGAGLAILGAIFLRRRITAEPGLALLLVLGGLNLLVLIGLGMKGYVIKDVHSGNDMHIGYISERHTVLLVMIGCVFASAALEPLAAALASLPLVGRFWAGRLAPAGLLLTVVAVALPATLKPLHDHREGHKHAGQWLASRIHDQDCLIDPFEWAQWYSGRGLHYVPDDPPAAVVTYAVVDNKEHAEDHARLPRMVDALNVKEDGRSTVVYHWPEDVPVASAKVRIYKLVRPGGK